MINEAGPMWVGDLFYSKLIKNIKLERISEGDKELLSFIKIIKEESKINTVGFYDIHKLSEKHRFKLIKNKAIIKKIRADGYKASLTHFSGHGIRTDMALPELIKLLKR